MLSGSPLDWMMRMVLAECGIGALVLTGNVILLGGDIVFFQSLCLLGYCLFPLCVSAFFCTAFPQIVGFVLTSQ